jgi:hypothetical protein
VRSRSGRARSTAAGPVSPRERRDDGMVTAEFAVALPAFVVVVMAAVCGVAVVTAQLRCADAAAVAARMAARGESAALVQSTALNGAPGDAQLVVSGTSQLVTATVRAELSVPVLSGLLPRVWVHAQVVEAREPSVTP